MNTTNESIGRAVRSLIEGSGATTWKIAVEVGLSPAQIRDRLAGRIPFKILELLRFADVLGKDRDEFLSFVVNFKADPK